jgi:hypothetical protein
VGFDAKRTQVAQSAFDFARYFSSVFDSVRVLGSTQRRPRLVTPEGMSTAGGKRARQSIVLQPDDPAGTALTVGWVDIGERRALLRTHGCLEALHFERFKNRPFDMDRASYAGFFDQVKSFFDSCGLAVTVEGEPGTASVPPSRLAEQRDAATSGTSSSVVWLMTFSAFMLGAVVGGFIVYLRLRGH